MLVTHEFGPWYDTQSRVLVLGTMPSPKSREAEIGRASCRERV